MTIDYAAASETPAPVFALKAFRTAVFGTPYPTQDLPRIVSAPTQGTTNSTQTNNTASSSSKTPKSNLFGDSFHKTPKGTSDLTFSKDIDRTITKSDILKERSNNDSLGSKQQQQAQSASSSSATTTMQYEPRKPKPATVETDDSDNNDDAVYRTPKHNTMIPPGILVTPGFASTKKKVVSFAASTSDEVKPRPQARIRSGLPTDFPGKFPSPWTPRTATPKAVDARSAKVLFSNSEDAQNEPPNQPSSTSGEEGKQSAAAAAVADGDVTVNLDFPISTSGKYWKERVEDLEGKYERMLAKSEKWREITRIAKDYAKKKDSQCAEMAEKLRGVMKENQRLQSDMEDLAQSKEKVLSRYSYSKTTTDAAESKKLISELRETIAAYEKKMQALESLLDERDNQVTELSMYIEETPTASSDELIRELKRHLRKARTELREMTLTKMDNDSKRLRIANLETELSSLKTENLRLEAELKESRGGMGDTSHLAHKNRSLHENRLKLQVERLEQEKMNLLAETREKVTKEATERRELDRKYKVEIRELDSKLESSKLAAERRDMEYSDVTRRLADMERQLSRRSKELEEALHTVEEMRKNVTALAPLTPKSSSDSALWQAKQRATLQELRQAKEDCSDVRVKLSEKEAELQRKTEEVIRLRFRLHGNDIVETPAGTPVRPNLKRAGTTPAETHAGVRRKVFVEKETDTLEVDKRKFDAPLERPTTPTPAPRAATRTPIASPSKRVVSGSLGLTSSPSRQLQRDIANLALAAGTATATTSTRFLNRHPRSTSALRDLYTSDAPPEGSPSRTSRFTSRNTPGKDPVANTNTLFTTSRPVLPAPFTITKPSTNTNPPTKPSTSDDPAEPTTNNSNPNLSTLFPTYARPSPRASYIPLDIHQPHRPARVSKRTGVGNESTTTVRRVSSGGAGGGVSRRLSSGGIGKGDVSVAGAAGAGKRASGGGVLASMDPVKRAAAQARLAEKKRARMKKGGGEA